MSTQRRRYSRAVKAEAVRRVIEDEQPPARVARDMDVNPSALRAWVHEWRRTYRDPDRPKLAELADRAALEEQNQALRTENEFLKKAQAFFSTSSASPNAAR